MLHTAAKDNSTLKIRERLTVSIFFPALEYEKYWQEYFSKVTPIGIFGLENHKIIKWIAPISDVNIAEISPKSHKLCLKNLTFGYFHLTVEINKNKFIADPLICRSVALMLLLRS